MPSESGGLAVRPPLQVGMAQLISSVVYSREEKLTFSAHGTVQTTDGLEVTFNLGLEMERHSVLSQSETLVILPVFIDPLILNFGNCPPLLTDSSFLFDLDGDGSKDSLSCLGKGCGFLAFDRNNDGIINDGTELFGPTSGFAFGELTALDGDAKMWIDENDPVFDQLKLWNRDEKGISTLLSLREAGVGAISVLHAGTDFQLEGPAGEFLGTLKKSGIFLTEKGQVQSLQEIDLAEKNRSLYKKTRSQRRTIPRILLSGLYEPSLTCR